ncbi:MAG: UDP-N-acetylmuramoyl-L-alanyl-D-glutamate--2,6-diaminopimelate ligase [Alphaproteobacteria bacterium]|nr:UDP-N-acetylmuramoyl-L-alanyl-D-glutamate--2,6-diaminopimelate ligase [Alphaproteobacteria bacterium]
MRFATLMTKMGMTEQNIRLPQGSSLSDYQEKDVTGICLCADKIQEGNIFPVVKGEKFDGMDFLDIALERKVGFLLADREIQTTVPVIVVSDLRQMIAKTADILYPTPQMTKIAVTGTNGKTSVSYFVQQILNALGKSAASLGTIGIQSPVYQQDGSMTTPDSVTLHQSLSHLSQLGVTHVALEASSHGLDQNRVGAIDFQATGFTNLTRDHLDYHKTMASYLQAKMKLFLERTSSDGVVVLNADIPEFNDMLQEITQRGLRVYTYGANATTLKLISRIPTSTGQDVIVKTDKETYSFHLNLYGDFQVMNVLCAVGLCMGVGADISDIMNVLPSLKAPDGRMERVDMVNGASVFVDYAHTPDALERVLISLRPHATRRLICVFGCGGNRDTGKRSQMGEIANRLADVVYITDDNPRLEDAALIRHAIKEACPKGIDIDGRLEALYEALCELEDGDVLVVCGKGHETGQTIGTTVYRFNDKTEILSLTAMYKKDILWRSTELSMALNTTVSPYVCATGVSIDTRTLTYGDLFVALKGDRLDGHDYVGTAIDKGACACIVDHVVEGIPAGKQIIVSDTLVALESLARFARMRSEAVFIGVTGSSGKTTTKEMLRTVLEKQGRVFATSGNFNNQIGVPLMLSQMPLDTEYAIIEMGMNHFGEMAFLSELVRPNHTLITMTGSAHRAYFKSDDDIAVAKGEIFEYADSRGTAVLNSESPQYHYLSEEARQCGIRHIVTFGEKKGADFELVSYYTEPNKTIVHMRWHGLNYHYEIGFTGRHFALNSLAVLAMVDAVGASVDLAMNTLAETKPVQGRGLPAEIGLPTGQKIILIDDAYNANPKSVEASLSTLGAYRNYRRIAVLGDMLELGDEAVFYHRELLNAIQTNQIDIVFCVGTLMKELYNVLPVEKRGGYALTADEILPVLMSRLYQNDVVLVKASNSMNLKKIIAVLKGEK